MGIGIFVWLESDHKKLVDTLHRNNRGYITCAGSIDFVIGHSSDKGKVTVGISENDAALFCHIDNCAGDRLAVGINHTAFDFLLAGCPERERACEQHDGRQ